MKIVVIGTWYVGLIQAVGLAKIGYQVTAVDVVEEKIALLKQGIPPIYENDLPELLQEVHGNIEFTLDKNVASGADIIFLCVPTPQDSEGKTDLSYLRSACEWLKSILTGNEIVIVKSTVPMGTNAMVYEFLGEKNSVVSNPEFLREGVAIYDFFHPSRVILGYREGESEGIKQKVRSVYDYFKKEWVEIIEGNWQTVELIKYAANAFLATKLSFMNEVARLSDKAGADIRTITHALWTDPRIGSKHLSPGLWYGGSCFPKDVRSLMHQFASHGLHGEIIDQVDRVNSEQAVYFVSKILAYYHDNLDGKTFALSGLAFKPDTDDLRESKGIEVISLLLSHGANIRVHDYTEKARVNFMRHSLASKVTVCENFEDLFLWADCLIVTLEDTRIQKEDFSRLTLRDKTIFDGRNILPKEALMSLGYSYFGIGC